MSELSTDQQDQAIDRLLGGLEAPVMRLVWARKTATVREILDLLRAAGRPLAYTTVMTVMSRLAAKDLLVRELVGKTHSYRAATSQEGFLRAESARQVHALVEEFGDLAIAHFLAEVEGVSPERRRQLEGLVADAPARPEGADAAGSGDAAAPTPRSAPPCRAVPTGTSTRRRRAAD